MMASAQEKEVKKVESPSSSPSTNGAKQSTTAEPNPNPKSPPSPKGRRSFISRLFSALVPCVTIRSFDDAGHDKTSPNPSEKNPPSSPQSPSVTNGAARSSPTQTSPTSPPKEDNTQPASPPVPEPSSSHNPESVMSSGVQSPGSEGTEHTNGRESQLVNGSGANVQAAAAEHGDSDASYSEEEDDDDMVPEDDEDHLILNGGAGIPIGPDGLPKPLLPPVAPHHVGRKCLVLDLDETLVHSSFKSLQQADYVVPVEIEYHWHNVYVIKRPGVDNFLKKMGEHYEIVVFTASLSKYADPVLDKLDIHQVVSHRLFRESCYNHRGNYVKDLSQLGRPISETIILDNSPASYIFHPNNAVPVSSWFNDPHDTELTDLIPFLGDLGKTPDVRGVLDGAR